ncbi:MAG TPA: ATP-binding protein [Vicinamibacterales bacterium]|nr:ATP-binding protein [Vicinamibacterales bacterium]
MRTFRIRERIAAGFVAVALLTTSGAGLASLSFVSRTLDEHVRSQIDEGATLVSRSDFALNPLLLRLAAEVSQAHIVTFSRSGIVASTLGAQEEIASVVASRAAADAVDRAGGGTVFFPIEHRGVPYQVAYRPVEARGGTYVAVASDTSRLAGARRAAMRAQLSAALVSIALLGIVGFVVARRVSRPIEETLVRAEKLAVTGLLAARVAHDVRNPLSSIKMQTQLLQSRLRGDADNQALLAEVLRDVDQVELVIRGLLELARPGGVHPRPTDLNELVRSVLDQVNAQMTHRKIRVEASLDGTLPLLLLDPDRLRLALLNLIANAADAMVSGGTLSVSTARAEGGRSAHLDVCDDGSGIDPAVADRLFNPFVSTKHDGIGLGLVNTRAIVESHGGTVTLGGRPGRGTRARITLPIAHG